ncbi:Asp-tRNA(Asn)/Glu-tRNA(Gln) amidotransferase subunit GatC [Mycoplasma sp. HS2188]|uniref:Asp-tRNA(Asn)/Glu-tRNA(Gln) amidotransferase subunit GatC n=1 Tax=Mycoplasma sp. HS2188 TaxID=2976765 RepID=UPI0021AA6124|nr:Asp-tRNA(Asn)/Glu-tRNA(Gln) amidotransferase subunit GatC [Mycoplasma sp. HS2188]MCT4469838.1 aspartyl/glutamyl-tRNA amidotransferase subunit C [Mycoplasma sp. HS2188]
MKVIDKEKLISIVKNLLLEPSDEVIEQILSEWNILEKQISNMQKIDTEGVKPLTHINEKPLLDFFREDIENNNWAITKEQALQNASDADEDYIITSKVVK